MFHKIAENFKDSRAGKNRNYRKARWDKVIDVDILFQKDQEIGQDHKIIAGRSDEKL